MNALAELLSSRVKAEIFRLLFGVQDQELHVREIERQSGLADATVRQELKRLVCLGLIEARRDGNRIYYHAQKQHPLFFEIHNLVLKTTGLVEVLRNALAHDDIRVAFVFGSVARSTEKAHSDVDLMVIGSIGLRQLTKLLSGVSRQVGRELNPHIMTITEFKRRRKTRDHFLTTVLAAPRLFVIGDEHELETVSG
jgi:predicted nucleotidyltransferase